VAEAPLETAPVALVSLLLAALLPCALVPAPVDVGPPHQLAALLTAIGCLCLLVIAALDRWWIPAAVARRYLGVGVLAGAVFLACAQAALLQRPWPGAVVMVVVVGDGLLRLPAATFSAVLASSSVTWFAVAVYALASGAPPDGWLGVSTGVAVSAVLALAARAGRMRALALIDAAEENLLGVEVRDLPTGTLNARGLEIVAVPMIENARRQGGAVSALFIDIDGLGQVNMRLGVAAGDVVLRCVADTIRHCVRSTDVVCRRGGDEFVVVGPGTGMSPLELERRVRTTLTVDPPVDIVVWPPRVTVGSATLVPWDDGDLSALVERSQRDFELRRSLRRSAGVGLRQADPPRKDGEAPVAGGTST